jgi:hypothetical protein
VVEGAKPDKDRAVPTFWYGSVSMRKGDYRTTLYQDGSSEHYHLDKDRWLSKNLAGKRPEYDTARQDLLRVCKEYGVHVVEGDTPVTRAAPYFSLVKGAQTPKNLGSDGVISIGAVDGGYASPGYKRQFATLETNGTVKLAPGLNEMHYAADTNGGVTRFKVIGNNEDNRFIFKGGHNRFSLEIDTGPGDNLIRVSHDTLTLRTGSGENLVEPGVGNSTIHSGTGNTTVMAGWGNNLIHGGSGDDTLAGGAGDDKITSGTGKNRLVSGTGRDTITITGGINRIFATDGETALIFMRTELPQTIETYGEILIDLSDWAIMGKTQITRQGQDVVISSRTERVIVKNAEPGDIRKAIIGVELETAGE